MKTPKKDDQLSMLPEFDESVKNMLKAKGIEPTGLAPDSNLLVTLRKHHGRVFSRRKQPTSFYEYMSGKCDRKSRNPLDKKEVDQFFGAIDEIVTRRPHPRPPFRRR